MATMIVSPSAQGVLRLTPTYDMSTTRLTPSAPPKSQEPGALSKAKPNSSLPAHLAQIPTLQVSPKDSAILLTRAQETSQLGLVQQWTLELRDALWRGWMNLVSTWGISVMEPWERVFALFLFASLFFLLGVAIVKFPAAITYSFSRLSYYLFGYSSPSASSSLASKAALSQVCHHITTNSTNRANQVAAMARSNLTAESLTQSASGSLRHTLRNHARDSRLF
ncbi:hypothetical protein BCV70DRAFT_214940 [Testicularia cyperi]|uniref:Uncharacterized protein n=1 Tax=Testicularia cyperi TaxID=1882483 RepID=A0A317Y1V0_9BASI|nr:hypothetical protein BCV70DRAFT_214940 [Testicularia cyperi]